jgi:hypothetical protein
MGMSKFTDALPKNRKVPFLLENQKSVDLIIRRDDRDDGAA